MTGTSPLAILLQMSSIQSLKCVKQSRWEIIEFDLRVKRELNTETRKRYICHKPSDFPVFWMRCSATWRRIICAYFPLSWAARTVMRQRERAVQGAEMDKSRYP